MHGRLKSIIFTLFMGLFAVAQGQRFVLSGFVTDEQSGRYLSDVALVDIRHNISTVTDDKGFFTLYVPFDSVVVRISQPGYKESEIRIRLNKDEQLRLMLTPAPLQRKFYAPTSLFITGTKHALSSTTLKSTDNNKLPQILTNDLLKGTQYLPGFQKIIMGSSMQNIRGSSYEQNLVTFDGAPVYYPYHLLGVYSLFDRQNSQQVTINRSHLDPKYGGGLSSQINIQSKSSEGETNANLGFDILFLKAGIDTKLGKQDNLIASYRRSYIDAFLLGNDSAYNIPIVQDFHIKYSLRLKQGGILSANTLQSTDQIDVGNKTQIIDDNGNARIRDRGVKLSQKNTLYNLDYTYIQSKKAIRQIQAYYSQFAYATNLHSKIFVPGELKEEKSYTLINSTGITDIAVRFNHKASLGYNKGFSVGGQTGIQIFNTGSLLYNRKQNDKPNFDSVFYQNKPTFINSAIYGNYFMPMKNGYSSDFAARATLLTGNSTHFYLDPRIAIHKFIDSSASLDFSYDMTHQHYHVLAQNNYGTGVDNMVPVNKQLPVQRMQQIGINYTRIIKTRFILYAAAYYRLLNNQSMLKPGLNTTVNSADYNSKLIVGKGRALGLEVQLKKTEGLTTGWISYTYTRSRRTYDEINLGESFPYQTDRSHEFNIVAINRIGKRNYFTICYTFCTGNPITPPVSKYRLPQASNVIDNWNGQGVAVKGGFNNYRTPHSSRIDFAFQVQRKSKKWKENSFHFSIYNTLNQLNAYDVRLERDDKTQKLVTVAYRLFGFIPTISYHVVF